MEREIFPRPVGHGCNLRDQIANPESIRENDPGCSGSTAAVAVDL